MTSEESKNNFEILENRWLEDEEMYSSTMTIDIDEEFMQSIYKAIEALEKQIPKEIEVKNSIHYYCPSCDLYFDSKDWKSNYCGRCGQAIKWK